MIYKRENDIYKRIINTISIVFAVILCVFSMGVPVSADSIIASESVNLREKPSTEAKVLKLVPMGYEVEALEKSGDWTKVKFEGSTGYVKSEFLETIKSSSTDKGNGNKALIDGKASEKKDNADPVSALRNGDEGDSVKELQQIMKDLELYDGPVNGKFGPLTEEAVLKFQEKAELTVDGVAGSETLAKLKEKKAALNGTVISYRNGDEGDEVKKIQTSLKSEGFYTGPVNGRFGPLTEEAIISFQKANKLEVDGIAGRVTMDKLYAKSSESASSSSSSSSSKSNSASDDTKKSGSSSSSENAKASNGVELTRWADAKTIMKVGVKAKVYDVRTGTVYYVKSFSNGRHADVEPVTKEDTALLKSTYGGVWNWNPRPVWVTINGHTMAASINGMPHGGGVNNDNGMDGQVCLHFLGSSTHNGNKSFSQLHQDGVMEAWNAANKK